MKPKSQPRLKTTCIYCGYEVRFQPNKHKECEVRYKDGLLNIKNQTKKYLIENGDLESLGWIIHDIAITSYISKDKQIEQMRQGFNEGVIELRKGDNSPEDIEKMINQFVERFPALSKKRDRS
jgi:hypothetical protein